MQEMPNRGKHIAMFVLTWVFFWICALFSIGAFITMNKRIAAGDAAGANESAKKVRTCFIVSLIIFAIVVVLYIVLIAAGVFASVH